MASFQQAQLAHVSLGDRAEMSMRAIPGVTWTGYVDAILGDRSSVRIVLDPWQKTDRLHPGMAVVATIETEQ
jgi:multidrug resistance efflux pump